MCISRLSSVESAESHYKAVLRALVAETLELSTFLDQIVKGTQVRNLLFCFSLTTNWIRKHALFVNNFVPFFCVLFHCFLPFLSSLFAVLCFAFFAHPHCFRFFFFSAGYTKKSSPLRARQWNRGHTRKATILRLGASMDSSHTRTASRRKA